MLSFTLSAVVMEKGGCTESFVKFYKWRIQSRASEIAPFYRTLEIIQGPLLHVPRRLIAQVSNRVHQGTDVSLAEPCVCGEILICAKGVPIIMAGTVQSSVSC